ncbi:ATP-binding cassette domain-containing protein, partial [Blautia wexlerae]|nr:ATP-binding cassette domain-containing protein [Blautia wexlerae]
EKLFDIMRMLKEQGLGVVFVTHFLDQVYEVTDTITVLRNGAYVGTYTTADLPRVQLVAKMIGKEYGDLNQRFISEKSVEATGESLLSLKDATSAGSIEGISLDIHKGDVLGLSGLLGSGRSEIVRLIFGVDHMSGGEMDLKGQKLHNKGTLAAIRSGFAFCPENRKTEGIVGDLSIRENIILALQAKRGMFKAISRAEAQKIADEYIEKLEIKTPSADQLIRNLSGGNQQKVILARWLATNPDLLMLDEPTRGIDIGTKAEIQKLVVQLAEQGMAVIFISSEIDEMLRCCGRMIVLRDKKKVAELNGQEISEAAIMHYIAGGAENEPA